MWNANAVDEEDEEDEEEDTDATNDTDEDDIEDEKELHERLDDRKDAQKTAIQSKSILNNIVHQRIKNPAILNKNESSSKDKLETSQMGKISVTTSQMGKMNVTTPPMGKKNTPFLESNKNLKEGEVLEFDNRAYEMMHRATTEW